MIELSLWISDNISVHDNGIESHYPILERMYKSTFHNPRPEHLDRYPEVFARCHTTESGVINEASSKQNRIEQKRLQYRPMITNTEHLALGVRA